MQPDAGDLEVARIKALQENADRLGLIWRLRPATVVGSVTNSADRAAVVIDGDVSRDPVPIDAVSMIGPLQPGARVYVITSPPAGNHIVGRVNAALAVTSMDANRTGGGDATGAITTTEVAIPSANYAEEPLFSFAGNSVFRVIVTFLLVATVEPDTFNLRVRKGAATITGTLLANWQRNAYGGNNGENLSFIGYFTNTGPSVVQSKLSLSAIRVAGSGSIFLYGPVTVAIENMGSTANLPGLAAGAVSV